MLICRILKKNAIKNLKVEEEKEYQILYEVMYGFNQRHNFHKTRKLIRNKFNKIKLNLNNK